MVTLPISRRLDELSPSNADIASPLPLGWMYRSVIARKYVQQRHGIVVANGYSDTVREPMEELSRR